MGALVAGQARAQGFTLASPVHRGRHHQGGAGVQPGGCKGGNISPALSWRGAPAGTKSFALTLFDPDAPTGSGFWHWVVFNIRLARLRWPRMPATRRRTCPERRRADPQRLQPDGVGGPCPPPGDKPHHYVFTLSAVDQMLPLDAGASAAVVGFMLHFHTLAKSQLTGRYGDSARPRPKDAMPSHTFFCVDAHTCGNPVRVVAGGAPMLPHVRMAEKRHIFRARSRLGAPRADVRAARPRRDVRDRSCIRRRARIAISACSSSR